MQILHDGPCVNDDAGASIPGDQWRVVLPLDAPAFTVSVAKARGGRLVAVVVLKMPDDDEETNTITVNGSAIARAIRAAVVDLRGK
jgi:hypothetical protein|tara:strand:+ start:1572 stop:1829 length:258 start_codon:yes stop_codon:yes gene_type:complete